MEHAVQGTGSLTLGQFSLAGADPSTVPQLPRPPLWEVWLFESAWTPAIGLLAAGVVAFWLLNRAGKARQGALAGAGCVAAAGALLLTAMLVETPREQMVERTRALIRVTADQLGATIARGEDPPLADLLAEDVVLMMGGQDWLIGSDQVMAQVETVPKWGVRVERAAVVRSSAQSRDRNSGFTQVWVRAEGNFALARSWWRIGWRRESDPGDPSGYRWRATTIDCLQLDGMVNPGEARRFGN
ncbi:MAG: hypothetical protein KF768_03755 [Phycisphaeraceae bacterium]|nr:hypothetical protein [Phycisphaeraceae bacterium]